MQEKLNYHKSYNPLFFLSALFPLISIYCLSVFTEFSDGYDIIRHRSVFNNAVNNIDKYREYYYSGDQLDILFYFLIDVASNAGINEINFFAILSICIFYLFYLFLYLISYKNKYLALTIAILVFINMSLLSGIRFYLGLSFLSIALLLSNKDKYITAIFFFILSIFSHFSLIIYLPLLLIKNININFCRLSIFTFFILVSILSIYLIDIINQTINFFGDNIYIHHIKLYLDKESLFERAFLYYIFHYSPVIISFFIFKNSLNKNFSFAFYYSLFILCLNLNNFILFDRAFLVFVLILSIFFISNYSFYSILVRRLYITTISLYFITEIYSNLELYF